VKILDLRLAALGVAVVAVLGCSPAATAPTAPGTSAARPSLVQPTQAGATTAGGALSPSALCAAVTPALATAALGGPVDAPQSGEVVPRPNGVYCHYSLTGAAGTNVEAQLNQMTRAQFEQLATAAGATVALPGIGEVAFRGDTASMGGSGSRVAAWSNGRGVTVILNRQGADQAILDAAAAAIATAALAS
jgi:hypothetical protein